MPRKAAATAKSPPTSRPVRIAADGTRVFFISSEKLNAADLGSSFDVYVRDLTTERTELVSIGDPSCAATDCGNGPFQAVFQHASADGTKAEFTTEEALVATDTDGENDIYQRDLESGTTSMVTADGSCPAGLDCRPTFGGASADSSHVFFESNDRISGADTDGEADVYDWNGGTPTPRLDRRRAAATANSTRSTRDSSADGATVYFETSEQLDAADTDGAQDVYARASGGTSLVSTGPGGGNGASRG